MNAQEIRDALHGMYGGENKVITDNNYDQSLAVKCINGRMIISSSIGVFPMWVSNL